MGVIQTTDEFTHPKGKIVLLDGRELWCYAAKEQKARVNNQLSLDTSGVYFSVGKPTRQQEELHSRVRDIEERMFTDNAFLFLRNKERILSDSRMFLAPVPIQSGIAWTGTSGFQRPTLGIYLEWWMNCKGGTQTDSKGKDWLVYHLAGFPGSGRNHCAQVDEEGNTKCESVERFIDLWPVFMRINTRYDEAKSLYDAYSLEEVLGILARDGSTTLTKRDEDVGTLLAEVRGLRGTIVKLKRYANSVYRKLHISLMTAKRKEIEAFVTLYEAKQAEAEARLDELRAKRREMRAKLHAGEITLEAYQPLYSPISRAIRDTKDGMKAFVDDNLRHLFPCDNITLDEVKRFLAGDNQYLQ